MNFHAKSSRNSYTNKNLSDFIFILTCYNMVFKMALYLVLEKRNVFLLSIGTYLRLYEVMKMSFKKVLYLMN